MHVYVYVCMGKEILQAHTHEHVCVCVGFGMQTGWGWGWRAGFWKRLEHCQRMDRGIVFWSVLLKISRIPTPGKTCTEDFRVLSPGSDDGLHPAAATAALPVGASTAAMMNVPGIHHK